MLHPTQIKAKWGKTAMAATASLALLALGACASEGSTNPVPTAEEQQLVGQSAQDRSGPMALAMAPVLGRQAVDADVVSAQEWVRRLPKSADKLIELGRAWVTKARHSSDPGFYLHAKACVDLARQLEPNNHLATELLAQVLLNQHQFVEAKDLASQVLAKDPESLLSLAVLSDTLYELGEVDPAMDAANQLVSLRPDLPAYARVSFFQWLKGDADAALRSAKLAVSASNDPEKPEPRAYALVQAANIFFHHGDYEGADAGYKEAVRVMSDYPAALAGRGRIAMTKGDGRGAAELLRVSFKASPLVETAWRLGDAYRMAGDAVQAEAAYGEVITLGRSSDHRTLAAFLASKNRDLEEAARLIEGEMTTRPGVYTEAVQAWVFYRQGKFEAAKRMMDRALRYRTQDATLLYHAGAIDIANGKRAAGEKLVRKALALNPKFDPTEAAEAAELLER